MGAAARRSPRAPAKRGNPQRVKPQRAPKLFGRPGLDTSPNRNGRVWSWTSADGWRATLTSFRGEASWEWGVAFEGAVLQSRWPSRSLDAARRDLTTTIKAIRRAIDKFTGAST
jgi:hypothetical protein